MPPHDHIKPINCPACVDLQHHEPQEAAGGSPSYEPPRPGRTRDLRGGCAEAAHQMLDRLARAGLERQKTHPEEPERAILSGCGRSRTKAPFGRGVRSLGRCLKHGSDRFETIVGDLANSLVASRRRRSYRHRPRELACESRPHTLCGLSIPRQGTSLLQAPARSLALAVIRSGTAEKTSHSEMKLSSLDQHHFT